MLLTILPGRPLPTGLESLNVSVAAGESGSTPAGHTATASLPCPQQPTSLWLGCCAHSGEQLLGLKQGASCVPLPLPTCLSSPHPPISRDSSALHLQPEEDVSCTQGERAASHRTPHAQLKDQGQPGGQGCRQAQASQAQVAAAPGRSGCVLAAPNGLCLAWVLTTGPGSAVSCFGVGLAAGAGSLFIPGMGQDRELSVLPSITGRRRGVAGVRVMKV